MSVFQTPYTTALRSRWLMLIALLGALLLGSLLVPAVAGAHAQLLETNPADGALLDSQPDTVTLTFNEPVQIVPDVMQLFDADGLVSTLEASASGPVINIALPDGLEDGSYVVNWRVLSADGHPLSGAVTFSIGEASATAIEIPEDDSNAMPVMGTLYGIAYLTLLLSVGIIWFRVYIVHAVDDQSIRIATVAAIISSVVHLLLIPLTRIRGAGESVAAILDPAMWEIEPLSRTLRAFSLVVIGLFYAVRYARAAVSPTARRRDRWAVALGGLLALGSLTVVGHTTTVGPTWVVHGADFIHGVAGATWLGGLIGLGIYLTRSIRGRASHGGPTPAEATNVVARFSFIAALVFAGLGLSGLVMAVRILGSWDAMLHTTYGKVLIIKLIVVLVPFLFAIWNRFRLVPAVERAPDAPSAWSRLRMAVLLEAAFLIVIIGLTGFLVLQNPKVPVASAGVPAAAAVPFEQTSALVDGSPGVRIDPASTGESGIVLSVPTR
jgi:copper transport protein